MGTDLPPFDGDAFGWLKFVKMYLETAGEKCGFKPYQDMERIKLALRHPAKTLVAGYLENLEISTESWTVYKTTTDNHVFLQQGLQNAAAER